MSLRPISLSAIFLLSLGGCTHSVHQYHVSDVVRFSQSSTDHKRVSASSEQFVVMGFVHDTDYVNRAFSKLQEQCPSGRVTGIHTRYSTSHGFFSWTNTVKMTGICVM